MALKSVRTPSGCPKPPVRPAPRPKPPKEGPIPPPPPFPFGGCCGPTSTVVLDNIDVVAGDNVTVEQGFVNGVKAFRISTEESDHIEVKAGENVTVDKTVDGKNVTFKVNAVIPEQKPVKVDPELMYGDGLNTPLGVYEYDGDTAGLVPDAPVEPENKFLRADGEWATITIPEVEQSDWSEQDPDAPSYIKNKPELATVATTGSYDDLTDKPTIKQSDWAQDDYTQEDFIKNKPELATVATTGSYDDLTDKPTIKQSDWAQDDYTQEDFIKNKPGVYAGSDAGLVPPGTVDDHEKFLRGDGSWETVITDMPDFIGATANEDGVRGVVPAPQVGDRNKLLCGDGSWTGECTANEMNDWLDEADREANNG